MVLAAMLPQVWAAETLHLCIAGPGGLAPDIQAQWQSELERILSVSAYRLEVGSCQERSVEVRFLKANPMEPAALAAARVERRKIQPRVEVYMSPLAEMIGTQLPGPLGRAMARVTAHELRHVMAQEHGHGKGADRETYSAGLLLAAKPDFFRLR